MRAEYLIDEHRIVMLRALELEKEEKKTTTAKRRRLSSFKSAVSHVTIFKEREREKRGETK